MGGCQLLPFQPVLSSCLYSLLCKTHCMSNGEKRHQVRSELLLDLWILGWMGVLHEVHQAT